MTQTSIRSDLRARITRALEECRTLIPDAQADAVMAVVQPEIDRVRFRAAHYSSGRCRHCRAAADDDFPWPEHRIEQHRMHCQLYVGPLEHERVRTRTTVLGNERSVCACGKEWADEDGGCPDAAFNWRGPVPYQDGTP